MARRPTPQLDLFGPPPAAPAPAAREERPWGEDVEALARGLHPLIHLGTSSWTFPGWAGICYPEGVGDSELMKDGLSLYARYPLFRTVGIDRSYYRPISREDLATYASQLPPGFRATEKVWERIVTAVIPRHARGGADAGQPNPHFLDPALFADVVHAPHVGTFEDHLACYLLEFPPMPKSARPAPEEFAEKLARFLDAAPKGPRWAVELRNKELLTPAYLQVLRERRVAHVYNWWGTMPALHEQLRLAPPTADFLVARLMLKPGTRYETRKEEFAPFDRIQDRNDEMRDDMFELAKLAIESGRVLRVIVNNKAEGSSPLTIRALAERMQVLK